jgi:hypothetical protein
MLRRYGEDETRRFWRAQVEAIDLVDALAVEEGIALDRTPDGTIEVAHKPSRLQGLAEEAAVIGRLLSTLAGSTWARTALRYGVIALAILLFLLALRRSGERAGRLAEQLETMEKTITPNDGCSRRWRAVLVLATIWLSGCTTGASDVRSPRACPPVVQYSWELQARAAEELAFPPEGSASAEMLVEYAVMRPQLTLCAQACSV